ncbi:MAG: L-threonylcarbamoyladenylate synthase [Candidatus Nanoarchaeia archaeon]
MNEDIIGQIKQGDILIYPTDTIYGLGCDAFNEQAVERIKKIKGRDRDKPLSVIAPSKQWIDEHCIIDVNLDDYLPGPYTLILNKKQPDFLKHVASGDKLGVRIPDCSFTEIIQKSGKPFITTSVNLSGEKPAICLDDISAEIKKQVDLVMPSNEKLSGKPSSLVINGEIVGR